MSSLTEFSICKLSKMKRQHIPMKVWWLKYFVCADSWDEQSAYDRLEKITVGSFISFFSLYLNGFLQSEIQQKLSSFQKITCITAIADNKIISALCVSGVLCSSPQSAAQIK